MGEAFALLHAGHDLAQRTSVCIDELVDLPMILLDLPISADYFLSLFEASAETPRIVERTRDMAVMRSMVGNAFGYSIANVRPQSYVSPDGSPLVCVPISGPVRPLRMGLLTTHGAEKSRTVRAFIDYAQTQGLGDTDYQIAYWSKLLQPLSVFGLALLAVVFTVGALRQVGIGARILVGILVGLAFKYVQDLFAPMSAVYGLAPWLAVAIPIAVCWAVGLIGARRVA